MLYFLHNLTGSEGSVETQDLVCTGQSGTLKRQPWSVSMKHSSRYNNVLPQINVSWRGPV